MIKKPIKRSGYLVTLSRDHHVGLLFCWKIKEGRKKGASADRIANYVRFFWDEHLNEHFQEEEMLLFNQVDCAQTRRAKEEHTALKKLFQMIGEGQLEKPNYLAFAEQLIGHIRFEERELFPYLEKVLSIPVLTGARNILLKLHDLPFEDKYPDEFWITKT